MQTDLIWNFVATLQMALLHQLMITCKYDWWVMNAGESIHNLVAVHWDVDSAVWSADGKIYWLMMMKDLCVTEPSHGCT